MKLSRMFSSEKYKGTIGYIDSQKKYEILRTVIYTALSLAILLVGYISTGTKMNLLTIFAVLGLLPASKSAIGMIMFLRYHSYNWEKSMELNEKAESLNQMFDMVFTTYDQNFQVDHLVVKGNTICGYSHITKFNENIFYKHIDAVLKADNYKEVSVKIFTDYNKYLERIEQLKRSEAEESNSAGIMATLKCVIL